MIAWGFCDAALAGAAESAGAPGATAAFARMTALSTTGISRPFDSDRDGFTLSEGAGILVLENWDLARSRGAHILAEITGFALNADAYHVAAPSPHGRGAASCMRLALEQAGLQPGEVGQVNAHGTSTPLNDAVESEAITTVFGPRAVPVTSIKGATGHALGAAGAIEAVAAIMSIEEAIIPPTLNTTAVAQELQVDVVLEKPRMWTPGPIVSNSFAFGGHNASLVLCPPTP
jgi:3-oxoacyl-[acyl-carrier-protein] synthase II